MLLDPRALVIVATSVSLPGLHVKCPSLTVKLTNLAGILLLLQKQTLGQNQKLLLLLNCSCQHY